MKFKEIYTRIPTDINYRIKCETSDDIEAILAQIRMILGTRPTEVLGSPFFGINLKQYLFNYSFDTDTVRMAIIDHFNTYMEYDHQKYQVLVDVKYGKNADDTSDYALIDITINQNKCLGIMVTQN